MTLTVRKVGGGELITVRKVGGLEDEPGGVTSVGGQTGADPVLLNPPTPPTVYAYFGAPVASIIEGGTHTVPIRISKALAQAASVPVVLDGASTVDEADVSFAETAEFPIGVTEIQFPITTTGDAAGGTSKVAVLRLDPTEDPVILEDGGAVTQLGTNTTQGPDEFTLQITDAVVTNEPLWSFGGGQAAIQVLEGVGAQAFQLVLSAVSTTDVYIRVRTIPGAPAAMPGTDYVEFDEFVLIPQGETSATFDVLFPDNAVDAPTDAVVRLVGTLEGGDAVDGAVTEIAITVIDNDDEGGNQGTPQVSFGVSSQTITEGQSATVTAQLRTPNGTLTSFPSAVAVPMSVSASPGVQPGDYDTDFPLGLTNELLFEAGSSSASFVVNVLSDDIEPETGEFVRYELQPDPGGQWALDDDEILETQINFVDPEARPTFIPVAGMSGGTKRVIQFLHPVVPPAVDMPEYAVRAAGASSGSRIQTVRMKRNGDNLIVSAHSYALVGMEESLQGGANELQLVTADSGDTTPIESGIYPTPPTLILRAEFANKVDVFDARTDNVVSTIDWTSPTSTRFPQVGADLCRETVYFTRFMRTGATSSPFSTLSSSEDACCGVHISEKRFAGDDNVIIYGVRMENSLWRAADDQLAESDATDGEIYFRWLHAIASGGLGWDLALIHGTTSQAVVTATRLALVEARTDNYKLFTGDTREFFFAAIRSADPTALERAQGYIEELNVGTTVGPLGLTETDVYGPGGHMVPDLDRLPLRDVNSSAVGYAAAKRQAEAIATRVISDWTQGLGGAETGGSSPVNRKGAWHGLGPGNPGQGGTSGLYPSFALTPWGGWWLRLKIMRIRYADRTRLAIRDYTNGSAAWWWRLTTVEGGERRMVFNGTNDKKAGYRRLWQFNERDIDPNEVDPDTGKGPVSDFTLAPNTRSWNSPDTGLDDPDAASIKDFDTILWSHYLSILASLVEGWEAMRNPFAYLAWEEVTAAISRTFCPIPVYSGYPRETTRRRANLAAIKGTFGTKNFIAYQTGNIYYDAATENGSFTDHNFGGQLRQYAVPHAIASGFYGVTDDSNRAAMRGGGVAAGVGGGDFLGDLTDLLEYITSPWGVAGRTNCSTGSCIGPDPYVSTDEDNPPAFIPRSGRRGDLPHITEGESPSAAITHGFHHFFHLNGQEGFALWVANSFSAFDQSRLTKLQRLYRGHDNWIEGARAFSPGGGGISMPYAFILALSDNPEGDYFNDVRPDVLTEAEVRAGDIAWIFAYEENSGFLTEHFGAARHGFKAGWSAFYSTRRLGSDQYDRCATDVFGLNDATDAEIIEHFVRADGPFGSNSIEERLTDTFIQYAQPLYMWPWLARVLNRRDGI